MNTNVFDKDAIQKILKDFRGIDKPIKAILSNAPLEATVLFEDVSMYTIYGYFAVMIKTSGLVRSVERDILQATEIEIKRMH